MEGFNPIKAIGDFIQENAMEDFGDPIKLACAVCDPKGAMLNSARTVFDFPLYWFWDKLSRYFKGSFASYDDRLKWCKKFQKDNKNYQKYIRRMIDTISKIENDVKVDYYANLTRWCLVQDADVELFFRLSQFLLSTTVDDLRFMEQARMDAKMDYNISIFYLLRDGLVEQDKDGEKYVFSDMGRALKTNCLNYNEDGIKNREQYLTTEQISLPEPIKALSWTDLDGATFNGGDANG